mgnify:CR=1 FL=1
MAEDSLLKFIFPKADPKGIQSGLNFVFPKANFDFAGEDTEEIIDDNEIIRPPLSKKTGGIDLNLIPDEIQEKLNLLGFSRYTQEIQNLKTLIVNAMNRLRESKVSDSGWEMVSKWAQWNIQSNPNEARPYVIAAAIFLKTEQKEKFELYCKHAIENGMKEDQLSREINTLMQW